MVDKTVVGETRVVVVDVVVVVVTVSSSGVGGGVNLTSRQCGGGPGMRGIDNGRQRRL